MIIPTTIRVNGKELNIGDFDTDTGRWIIKRNKERHFHIKMNAWGLDYEMFDYLKTVYGIKDVIIYDMNKRGYPKTWEISLEDIEKNKMFREFKPHRKQIFIEEKYWTKT